MSSGLAVSRRRAGATLRSGQLVVIGVLLGLALLAWWITDLRMAGMDAGPGTDPGVLGFYVTTWVVMMAAMMFPSIAPTVLMFRKMARGAGATALFVGGYLLVWSISGLIGYGILKLGRAVGGGLFAWNRAGQWAAVAVLAMAALYEFTPAKNACLAKCRSPLAFVMGSWRPGAAGALRMGFEHGGWCLGCCWALMAALFALGAMSLTWMALVTVLVAWERTLPRPARPARLGVAAVLVALGLWVALAPGAVPGLTIPGSGSMSGAMRMR